LIEKMKLDRKTFLKQASLIAVGTQFPNSWHSGASVGIGDRYKGLKSDRYLGEVKVEVQIQNEETFTEGPAVDRNGHVFFTNIPANKIYKWDPINKELSVFRDHSNASNGLRFLMNGDLLVCESQTGFVVKIDMRSGKRTVLAEAYNGKDLQSTNDLEYDAKGRIYFSSRSGNVDLEKQNVKALYRLDPDGRVHQLLAEPDIDMPNGVVVSPDQKTLYLIEAHPDEGKNRSILAFDLDDNGAISNRRTLIDFYPGRSGDGMCIDAKGNLYVAAGLHKTRGSSETVETRPGIHVISPKGKLLAFRETPVDTVTNCTFGGKDLRTLYISCGAYLLSMGTRLPGKPRYYPNK